MDSSRGPVTLTVLGVLPEYTGEGVGPLILTRAVERAFSAGATKVVVESERELAEPFGTILRHQGFRPV